MCKIPDISETYGYPEIRWNAAKERLREQLWRAAKRQGNLTYQEGANAIKDIICFDPHESVFHHMLGQISVEEDARGLGLLTALVVHKQGDGQPGPGFFELAGILGRKTSDRMACWVEEVRRLYDEAPRVPL